MAAPAPPHAAQPSGMFHAGRILLLVGAIVHVAAAVLLILFGLVFLTVFRDIGGDAPAGFALFFPLLYAMLGLLSAAGAAFGFVAQGAAQRGEAHKAWVHGLVASLLPPVQLITLAGAILCLVSPEGEAAKRRLHGEPLAPGPRA